MQKNLSSLLKQNIQNNRSLLKKVTLIVGFNLFLLVSSSTLFGAATINLTSSPVATAGALTICTGTSVTFTATFGCTPGTVTSYAWKIGGVTQVTHNVNATSDTWTTSALANGNVVTCTVVFTSSGGCNGSPVTTSSITVTVNTNSTNPTSASASPATITCPGNNSTLTLTGGGGGTSAVIKWYTGSCGGTLAGTGNSLVVNPLVTTTYYGRYEDPAPCSNNTTCATATVTVGTPTAPTAPDVPRCGPGTVTLSASGGTNTGYIWYDAASGGNILASCTSSPCTYTTPSLSVSTPYYVSNASIGAETNLINPAVSNGINGPSFVAFNITPSKNIILTKLSVRFNTTATHNIQVYYRIGTASGNETTAGSWTQLGGTYTISGTAAVQNVIDVSDLYIPSGQVTGFYMYDDDDMTMNNGVTTPVNNADITLTGVSWGGLATGAFSVSPTAGTLCGGAYYQTVSCESARTTSNAVINSAPSLTSNPTDQGTCAGSNASYSVTAIGTSLTYQWQESTNGGGSWNPVSNGGASPVYAGATAATLTLTNVPAGYNNYQYRCVVSGTCAPSATSSAANLYIVGAAPGCATLSAPSNGAINQSTIPVLSWVTGTGVTSSYDVYFGTSATPPFVTNTTSTSYSPATLVPGTTYYWQIVPRNGCGAATGCTTIFSFTTHTCAAPTVQASNITFANISATQMDVSWTNGNGSSRVVKMNTANSFTSPVNGTDPSANSVWQNAGEQVVYNGTGSTVTVTGLSGGVTYWFRVYEKNCESTNTFYYTPVATNNPNSQSTFTTYKTVTSTGIKEWSTGSTWQGGVAPPTICPTCDIEVYSPSALEFNVSPTVNNITIKSGGGLTVGRFTGQTLTVNGDFTIESGGTFGNIIGWGGANQNTNQTMVFKGNFTNNGTITAATAISNQMTLQFSGTSAQTISGSGTGTGLVGGVSSSAPTIPSLIISNTTGGVTLSTNFVSVAGAGGLIQVDANAILRFGSSANQFTGSGTLTLNGKTELLATTFNGHYAMTGTRTISTGSTITYKNIASNITPTSNIPTATIGSLVADVSAAGTLTVGANTTISGDLTVTTGILDLGTFTTNRSAAGGTLSLAAGTTMKLGGSTGGQTGSNFPTNFSTITLNATSTVNYTGANTVNQTVYAIPIYGHLRLSNVSVASPGAGTTTKSLTANLTGIAGDLTIGGNATFDMSTFTANRTSAGGTLTLSASSFLRLSGTTGGATPASGTSSFPNNFSTITLNTTSTVEYYGATQTIFNTPAYGNLTITTAGTKTAPAGLTAAGNLTINTGATLTAGTFTHNVGGIWSNSGTFTAGTSTVNFNSTSTGMTIAGTLTGATGKFNNITFNGVGGGWTFSNSAEAGGNFTITNGSVTAPSGTLTLTGNYSNSATFTHNSGTVLFNSTVTGKTIAGTLTGATGKFNNITFNGVGGGWTFSNNAEAVSSFTITNGSVTAPSGTLTLTGDYTNSATFAHNNGTVLFNNSSSNQNLAGTSATTFYNLTLNKASGKNVILSGSNGITVNNALTITLGTLQTNANSVVLASAATISEAAGQTVLGNLTKTRIFSSPDNFGGMGVTITEASALGSTTVLRVTGTDIAPNGFTAIKRYFDITPTNNTGLNATLDFTYNNAANAAPALELNGNTAASLRLFRSSDLIVYEDMAGSVSGSTITVTGIDHFSRWTATSSCFSWSGAVSTDWSIAGNWQCGNVPNSSTAIVSIPSGKPRYPVITGAQSFSVKNITISGGASVTNNGTFNVAGIFTNSGTFTSTSGTIVLNGTSAQTISGNDFSGNTIKNLKISNTVGVTITSALTLTDVLSFGNVNNVTLATGGFLTLHSDAGNTARIADLTNAVANVEVNSGNDITGNVSVERYMACGTMEGGDRAYRLLTPSVNTSTSIHANWQEGAVSKTDNPNPGYGTHITGTTVDQTGGLDATYTAQPSLFLFNGSGWTAVTNTNTPTLSAKTGYLIFVRGDRNYDLNQPQPGPFTSYHTTLRAKGSLLNGTQTFPGLSGAADTAGAKMLVTNPYAAPINWITIYEDATANKTNFTGDAFVLNPHIGGANGSGGYVTVKDLLGTPVISPSGTGVTEQIQSGEAFFLTVKSGAANPSTFTVKEKYKSTNNNTGAFTPLAVLPRLDAALYFNDAILGRRLGDEVAALYNNSFGAGVDDNDADQMSNPNEDIAFLRSAHKLSIETRPLITSADTLFLFMQRMRTMDYQWEIKGNGAFDAALSAELVDNYTGTRTPLDLSSNTTITFNVNTGIAGSKATNRFYIVFNPSAPLPVTLNSIRAYEVPPSGGRGSGINVDWSVSQQLNMDRYEVEKSVTGNNFSKAGTVGASATNGAANYTWFDAAPNMGANFYRIKMIGKDGATGYSQVVKVIISKGAPAITVYPNPITGNTVTLQMTNLDKGIYAVTLTNKLGQVVFNKNISHAGGSATQTLELDRKFGQGTYQLKVTGDSGIFTMQVIKQEGN